MIRFERLSVPGPILTPDTKPFWDALANQQFVLQLCPDCGKWCFYPRPFCPHCWGERLEWRTASGKGHLKTWCHVHRPGHPAWGEAAPFTLGLVQLKEGPTMLSHFLIDASDQWQIGMALKVRVIKCAGNWLPFFERDE